MFWICISEINYKCWTLFLGVSDIYVKILLYLCGAIRNWNESFFNKKRYETHSDFVLPMLAVGGFGKG